MEQIWEGVLGDGLEGNFWEEGLPLCLQSRFECLHGCSGRNILWQLVPVWDYDDESYTAVGESLKYDLEAQCGWGQRIPRHMESRGGHA